MATKNYCQIIGTISTIKTLEKIISTPSLAQDVDILEIRLNQNMIHEAILKYIKKLRPQWKILITIRTNKEGGSWQISSHQRYKIFQKFVNNADFFDIELESDLFQNYCRQDFPNNLKIIASYHNYKITPKISNLQAKINKAQAWQADIIKLAVQANSQKNYITLEKLLSTNKNLSLIAMGKIGKPSRYEFPKKGSLLTYGFLDKSVAPGQLSCKILSKLLNQS